ncbi:MAG: GFA family protein [Burkholderiaceae bacterium]
MLTATCHCGAVKIEVPRRPRSLTNCNCSMCRRYGVLWAYYKDAQVRLVAEPGATDGYRWGRQSQTFIRCKTCGCVMQWKKLVVKPDSYTGVNARNFDPAELGDVKIRLLDGADTWKYVDLREG